MNVLQEILERRLATRDTKRPLSELRELARDQPAPRNFLSALKQFERLSVIAEVKFRSPSEGELRAVRDVAAIAAAYEHAGASALSILTEMHAFDGRLNYLADARRACNLPILRKDFLWDEYDLAAARVAQADAVLLIAKMLSREQLGELRLTAGDYGLGVLLEVHDEEDLTKAEGLRGVAWGVNHRNLSTMQIELETTARLFPLLPPDEIKVAESGLRTREELTLMHARGAQAVLIGTAFMKAPDPGKALAEFLK